MPGGRASGRVRAVLRSALPGLAMYARAVRPGVPGRSVHHARVAGRKEVMSQMSLANGSGPDLSTLMSKLSPEKQQMFQALAGQMAGKGAM